MESSADNLMSHMSSLGIPALKCNLTRSNFGKTASFHVCIEDKYFEAFTNMKNWPQHVIIREWFFKENSTSKAKRPQTANNPHTLKGDAYGPSSSNLINATIHERKLSGSTLEHSQENNENSQMEHGITD